MSKYIRFYFLLIIAGLFLFVEFVNGQTNLSGRPFQKAAAPLYRDPVYDGAADPVVVWNHNEKSWWMLYTSRRANLDAPDVSYCFGTQIAVASSKDNGKSWVYRGTLNLAIEPGLNTFWAPEIIYDKGIYHMFVVYIQGTRIHWGGDESIMHYTSSDMWNWKFIEKIKLSSDRVIDPAIIKMPDGRFKMWYKDDAKDAIIMSAESKDLSKWENIKGPLFPNRAEGPIAFQFKGYYWLLTDEWHGMRVYRSKDLTNWEKQGLVLDKPSARSEDTPSGAHGGVVVASDTSAYIFYFTHPGRKSHADANPDENGVLPYQLRRSSVQVAPLEFKDGTLVSDRDNPFDFYLPEITADLTSQIEPIFKDASAQYKVLMKNLEPDKFPKTYYPATGKFESSNSDWWCSGFYPGTLLYLYKETKDETLKTEAQRILKVLGKEQFNKTTHDLGFMMYCSFGNAYKINPTPEYKQILINSANSLISRFNPKVGCIKSWDAKGDEYLVIIDNMMNLELLFWATRATGDSSYYRIAVTHANTTMKNHFRKDYSSYHVLNYNAKTGEVIKKRTAQGFADESSWARGQAWGLYGYTMTYRETKDPKYLEQAQHIADYLINHPDKPTDEIPYWDYHAPNIPLALRDASAGAIMASALLELYQYVDRKNADRYFDVATRMLRTLSTPEYRAETGNNGGFILKHSVGHFMAKSEVDVPITYADYYYIEALCRYKNLRKLY